MTGTASAQPRRLLPTPLRPLLGLTLLVVEDSRFASEAIRQMALSSGARLRRADTLAAARRHLAIYIPSICIMDLGLPDGSGFDLIRDVARAGLPVLATSGDDGAEARAREAGAQGFLLKPLESLAFFQQSLLRLLPIEAHPRGPRPTDLRSPPPDPLAYRDDLEHARALLRGTPDATCQAYVAQFLDGVARCAGDLPVAQAAAAIARGDAAERDTALDRLRAHLDARLERKVNL